MNKNKVYYLCNDMDYEDYWEGLHFTSLDLAKKMLKVAGTSYSIEERDLNPFKDLLEKDLMLYRIDLADNSNNQVSVEIAPDWSVENLLIRGAGRSALDFYCFAKSIEQALLIGELFRDSDERKTIDNLIKERQSSVIDSTYYIKKVK